MTEINNSNVTINFQEIDEILQQIHKYTMKIEDAKVALKILKERYPKEMEKFLSIQGKPIPKSKEEKEKEMKLKQEIRQNKMKKKFFDSYSVQKAENEKDIEDFNQKIKYDLDILITEVNQLQQDNKELRKEIEKTRKEKHIVINLLNDLRNQKDNLEVRINNLSEKNKNESKKLKKNDFDKVKKEGDQFREHFESDRDQLEEKYHNIIEESILRERDHKKEIIQKRNVYDVSKHDENHVNIVEDEDISDRTPILNVLIEKWKFFNKYKKQMLKRYTNNIASIKEAFDKMMKFLGIDDHSDLPVVLEKMEDQERSIETLISNLNNEIDMLTDNKRLLEYRIQQLNFKNNKNDEDKNNFQNLKRDHNENLQKQINQLQSEIDSMRSFFIRLQPNSDNLITYLDKTYLSDYILEKYSVNRDVDYNESCMGEVLATIEDFNEIIEDFEKGSDYYNENSDKLINKNLKELNISFKSKLDSIKKENYISNFYNTIKNDAKTSTFDDIIKKMANDIVKNVNIQNLNKEKKK